MTEKGPLYGCMEPTATFGFIASGMESPTTEIQDFDRVMQVYWPRVLRFVMASVRDRDAAETLTQECFWSAYRNRNSFRGEPEHMADADRGKCRSEVGAKSPAPVLAATAAFSRGSGGHRGLAARPKYFSGSQHACE